MKKTLWPIILVACNNNGPATCPSPGQPTPGPADNHCVGQTPVVTNMADCFADGGPPLDGGAEAGDAGEDASAAACLYGVTMFGQEADDDDCKYHVKWTSTAICEGTQGVTFTVTATHLGDGTPVSGIPGGIIIEPFIPKVADAACDDIGQHYSPNIGSYLVETPPGSGVYTGPVVFDAPGDWTLRFHLHEECSDFFDDSPHGHAAFHITVP